MRVCVWRSTCRLSGWPHQAHAPAESCLGLAAQGPPPYLVLQFVHLGLGLPQVHCADGHGGLDVILHGQGAAGAGSLCPERVPGRRALPKGVARADGKRGAVQAGA